MPQFGCDRCGHPYALHSNGQTECRATGCSVPPDDQPCQGFVTARQPEDARVSA
jgi:hypothetical protein